MKYEDACSIEPRLVTAWLIKLPDGTKKLELWHKDATIEDVHNSCLVHFKKFLLGAQDVGIFTISLVGDDQSYRADARNINQDWEITLE